MLDAGYWMPVTSLRWLILVNGRWKLASRLQAVPLCQPVASIQSRVTKNQKPGASNQRLLSSIKHQASSIKYRVTSDQI